VATIIDQPYAILAHSAGALAAAQFMTDPVFAAVAKPVAFVWVDLDPLVPRWQVDYFHRGVASSLARSRPSTMLRAVFVASTRRFRKTACCRSSSKAFAESTAAFG
jgi:hypothetical protein